MWSAIDFEYFYTRIKLSIYKGETKTKVEKETINKVMGMEGCSLKHKERAPSVDPD